MSTERRTRGRGHRRGWKRKGSAGRRSMKVPQSVISLRDYRERRRGNGLTGKARELGHSYPRDKRRSA